MKLSIIIPVYNVERYLRQCLDSVCTNTDVNYEVICVDDGSTDSSVDILKEYEQKCNKLKVLTTPNGGAGRARNIGLDNASGEYVYFLDSDDYVLPNSFWRVVANLGCASEDFVCCNADLGNSYLMRNVSFKATSGTQFCEMMISRIGMYYPCQIWVYFFRREFLISSSILFPEGIVCEDEEFVWKVVAEAEICLKNIESVVYHRLDREGSVMYNFSEKHLTSMHCVLQHLTEYISKHKNIASVMQSIYFDLFMSHVDKVNSLKNSKDELAQIDDLLFSQMARTKREHRTLILMTYNSKLACDYYFYRLNKISRRLINIVL